MFEKIKKAMFEETTAAETQEFELSEFEEPIEPIETVETISIEQIYERGNLADKSRSIFKIEEFAAKFPKTLTQEVRKQSVLGVIEVAGFTLEELLADATKRTETLSDILTKVITGTDNEIQENEAKIKEAELLIETLKAENLNRLSLIEKQTELITLEKNKIAGIVGFVTTPEGVK